MKKIIIDTNGFLRLLLNDIPEQANQVEKILEQAKEGKVNIYVPQIVIFEIHFALMTFYHYSTENLKITLKSLISADYLQVEARETFIMALTFYKSESVSFVDCFLLSKSIIEQSKIFTFDKKLKKLL